MKPSGTASAGLRMLDSAPDVEVAGVSCVFGSVGGRTVVLTTNYLDEAEALCDRVVILRAGQVVADDTPAALGARTGRCLELECKDSAAVGLGGALRQHRGVLRTEIADFGLRVYLALDAAPEDVLREARKVCPVEGFRTRSPDLVEVFRALTAASTAA